MIGQSGGHSRDQASSSAPVRRARPQVEGLESRLLLYATLGGAWTYGSRITYSLVPDGTSIGGKPSTLYQSLTALFPNPNVWQAQFRAAAAVWQEVANINLVWVADQGGALGVNGAQQGDPRFGDIRISAVPFSDGTLGAAFSPPPANGGTAAGDIILNSTTVWRINSSYDLETVAIHEFGHALGMSHSQISTAVMYAYYNAMKQSLTSDDIAGIDSVYRPRQYDVFNSNGNSNAAYWLSTNLNPYMNSNAQLTVPSPLNLTDAGQNEWFWVGAPASTTGYLTVVVQASNLSLLSPSVWVYDFSFNLIGSSTTPYSGTNVSVVNAPITPGAGYLIQVGGDPRGSMFGAFGLQVNFGSHALAPVPPYYAYVAQASDGGGWGYSAMRSSSESNELVQVGSLKGWGDTLMLPGYDTGHGVLEGGSLAASSSRPFASMRLMAGPMSDPTLPMAPSSHSAVLGTSRRPAKGSTFLAIRAINRGTVNWALRAPAPSPNFGGSMRSRGVSTT